MCLVCVRAGLHTRYAEFTAVTDWHFSNVTFHEAYDLDKDPYQLKNIYSTLNPSTKTMMIEALDKQYNCAGADCL